ncbi:MAG: hypothetical protein KF884_08130 [Fimbriimonadaceae bacterium]|nr:hypothetical protein [Fimbriimonadaceae bacterium]QYK57518.1 MAG: hypothetical protein KF884_08130 [Fimbriimonadaceae bacterium]
MVWSDPEIKKLSQEFVTAADEVYSLYPEHPDHLKRAAEREDHRFFRRFGEAMPPAHWNEEGTKQGIYMIGPDAEYLEGRFAASGDPADIRARLRRALERWDRMREDKGYANLPVPRRPWSPPLEVEGELILRVNVRDLPRGDGDRSGARRHELPESGSWREFARWAWNEDWVGLSTASAFVPSGSGEVEVDPKVWREVVRKKFIDTVRGQAPEWRADEVKEASLTMRRTEDGRIVYQGRARAEGGGRSFEAKVYGEGVWESAAGRFASFDLVALGTRRGASRFNQRENDPGPAPMGVVLSLSRE